MATKAKAATYTHLALAVVFDESCSFSRYKHVRGYVTRLDNYTLYSSDEGGHLRGVRFNSQTDPDYLIKPENFRNPMYGYEAEWGVDGNRYALRDCRDGVKALTEINRKLERMHGKFGQPCSFGFWVQRLAIAMRIEKMTILPESYDRRDGNNWVDLPLGGYRIDRKIGEWVKNARERAGLSQSS